MISRIALSLALSLACSGTTLAADAIKPIPTADLSKLSKENADEVRLYRDRFEKEKGTLKGVELAQSYADVGAVHARVGLFDVAEVAFADAELIAPLDSRWSYLRALVATARGQDAAARQSFEKAYKLNPDYLPIRMALANSLIRANDLERARGLLDEFVAKHKTYPMPYAVLGDIAVRQKRFADAAKLFQAGLDAEPKANQLYGGLAYAQEQAGNKKAADAARARAGDVGPTIDDPIMARILPVIDLKLARPAAGAASTAAAPPPAADPKQAVLVETGFAVSGGQFDAARKRLDDGLKQFPDDSELLMAYARVEAAAGKPDAARARARAGTAASPKDAGAWTMQGLIEESIGDDAAALQSYTKAVSIDSTFARARIAIGNLQLRGGKLDDATKAYRAALTALPDSTDARARVIATQVLAGQCAAAVKETGDAATRRARDAGIAELYVRVASTCPASNAEQRKRALTIGENLYKSPAGGSAQVSEAYALALAANGKWQDAEQTQGAAVFDALSKGNNAASVALYRDFYQQLNMKKLPDRPWPAAHPLFKPERPSFKAPPPVAAKPAATAPAPAAAKPPVKK